VTGLAVSLAPVVAAVLVVGLVALVARERR
jgi:hypothetical protein